MVEAKKEGLKNKLRKLVGDFKNADGWNKSEEDLQTSFIVELLKILGWDSSDWKINTGQDVQTGKKPDIVLKAGSSKLLVIESKDAHKKDMLDGAYQDKTFTEQLFNYCHGEGLSWGILTNFVEWRLYSAYQKRLYKNIKYAFHDLLWEGADRNDYVDLLSDEGLFFLSKMSKENLLAKLGKIDSDPVYYPEQLDLAVEKVKKEFFDKIKNWRSQLKKYIEKNYPRSGADKIDLMAQQIIDRMIFIDICHDNGVVSENHIKSVLSSKLPKFEELKEKFRLMNDKFDTELFDHSECDEIKINDLVMIPIIKELDEIDFSKLSVNIIGEVYENYLGELLKTTSNKPETTAEKQRQKRKAQGIYYTPDYIVDYIVKNTVGELLKKVKTEKEIEKIRVIDPACGSGSFLIRVFDEFLNAYRRILKVPEGQTTLDEFYYRRKILQNNIFGVDLDERAVEITKLNMMIKALDKVKPRDMRGAHLLPNLSLNIRCGNSLISGEKIIIKKGEINLDEAYKGEISKLIELKEKFYCEKDGGERNRLSEEIKKLENVVNRNINKGLEKYFKNQDKFKPFNYKVAFCEIFKDGGFDVVVGNPPYVTLSLGKKQNFFSDAEVKFFNDAFNEVNEYKGNTYSLFIQKSSEVLKKGGLFSFIIPSTLLLSDTFKKVRKYILEKFAIKSLINLKYRVFGDAEIGGNLIFVFEKFGRGGKVSVCGVKNINEFNKNIPEMVPQQIYEKDFSNKFFIDVSGLSLVDKVYSRSLLLEQLVDFYQGIITGDNKKFLSDRKINEKYEKIITGKDINRYLLNYAERYVLFDKNLLWSNTNEKFFKAEVKIISRQTADRLIATYDDKQFFTLDSTHIQTLKEDCKYDLKYILAIFNSKLLNFIYKFNVQEVGRAFAQVKVINLRRLPIKKVETQEEKKIYDRIIDLVREMIKLNKTLESHEKNKTKIEVVDYEIDRLVYKLYGLTEEEIKIIEK